MKKSKYQRIIQFRCIVTVIALFLMLFLVPSNVYAGVQGLEFAGTGTSKVTIPDNRTVAAGVVGESSYDDFHVGIRFQPKVTGYVELSFVANSPKLEEDESWYEPKGFVELRQNDEKGKSIGGGSYYYIDAKDGSDTLCFGVKKGKTYCVLVEAYCGVDITATVHQVKKSTASKKTKAETLKRGKTIEGVIIAGEKRADWYKIKLTKQKQVKLSYTTKATDEADSVGIKITFCKSNGKKFSKYATDWVSGAVPSSWMKLYMENSAGKKKGVAPGTYYIKVEPNSAGASGYYTLKWN